MSKRDVVDYIITRDSEFIPSDTGLIGAITNNDFFQKQFDIKAKYAPPRLFQDIYMIVISLRDVMRKYNNQFNVN